MRAVPAACLLLFLGCSQRQSPSAYDLELKQIAKDIRMIDQGISSAAPIEKAGKIAFLLYRRASLTGDYGDFRTAESAIDRAVAQSGAWEELFSLKANLEFKLHRFPQIRDDLKKAGDAMDGLLVATLKADLAFQDGRYDEARAKYEMLAEKYGTWDCLARLAYYHFVTGDLIRADDLYRAAQEQTTAKQMGSYAWLELQRGYLRFSRGNYREALAHYQQAEEAYPGWWLVEDYVAEALGAEGRFVEAETHYRKLIARYPRPEFYHALGDLYLFMGRAEMAKDQHAKAQAGYLQSAEADGVHYFHHLSHFYADVRQEGTEAVRWARKDAELRDNFLTQDSLGWALYRDNKFGEALAAINHALSSNVQDSQIFVHAAVINLANGRTGEGRQLFQKAAEINPSYRAFHVHR